jgi:glutaminase
VIPEWDSFKNQVKIVYEKCKLNNSGKVADYIPELAKKNPNDFGVSICSIDG